MPKKNWTAVTVLVVVVGFVLVWPVLRPQAESNQTPVVRIGAILPLTGGGAEFGKDELVGAEIAIDRINAETAKTRIELLVEDSRTQARDGVSAYEKLMASRFKPLAFITAMSSVSSALVSLVQRDKVPLFCVAAAPALTQGNHFVFRALPAADYQARTLLEQSKQHLDYQTVSILFFNDDFGTSMHAAFTSAAKENGVNVLLSEGVLPDASEFRASLAKLIASRSDAVYVAAFGSTLASVVRQLRELGYKGILLTTLEIGYPKVLEVAGTAAEGAVFVDTRFDPESSEADTVGFVKVFKNRTHREPSLDAILAYDEIQMIYQAGSRRGFTPEGIRAGLLEIRGYQSLNGKAKMLRNGDVAYELVLKTVKAGKPVPMAEK